MLERRASLRVPGSAFSSLQVRCPRVDAPVSVVNISRGGALIECETRLTPGERWPLAVEINGAETVRVAAHVLRSEVAQIAPRLTYGAAVLFANPLDLREVGEDTPWRSMPRSERVGDPVDAVPTLHSREAFEQDMCRLLPIEAARVGPSLSQRSGCKSVYFMIPGDAPRYLQVFFSPTAPFEFEHFLLLEQWAQAAGRLPE